MPIINSKDHLRKLLTSPAPGPLISSHDCKKTLIRSGDLSDASPLVKQLRAGLTSYVEQVRSTTHLIENNTAVPVFEITEKPGTPMEAEIRSALVLSLDRR